MGAEGGWGEQVPETFVIYIPFTPFIAMETGSMNW